MFQNSIKLYKIIWKFLLERVFIILLNIKKIQITDMMEIKFPNIGSDLLQKLEY